MRVVLDACVLFPTVMREMLMGAAKAGLFEPRWSSRILEEWALAARKIGPEGETIARGEIAILSAYWPKASVPVHQGLEARLYLPDENDIHVLASAIHSSSDAIVTMNAKDFPRNILSEEGVERRDPDGFLWALWSDHPDEIQQVADAILNEARRLFGEDWTMRKLLKKARLPRLAKALTS